MLRVGGFLVMAAALAALLGPALTPFDPASQDLAFRLAAPSATHPFGLDELGRDILARVLAGAGTRQDAPGRARAGTPVDRVPARR